MTRALDEISGLSLTVRQIASLEFMQGTVEDVVRSPDVYEFCIGISSNPARRRAAYSRWCRIGNGVLRGFTLLDWNRSGDQIRDCEQWLFSRFKDHPKYSRNENHRYYPSVRPALTNQAVYLAWWYWNE